MNTIALKHAHDFTFDDWNPNLFSSNVCGWGAGGSVRNDLVLLSDSSARRGSSASSTGGVPGSGSAAVTTGSSPFRININWDASVGSAPAGFTTAVNNAVQYLESVIINPVTITINVGWGEVAGSPMDGGSLGSSEYYLASVDYAQLVGALKADATSATDASMLASLPASSPISGNYWLTTAQAKALGLATGTATDGFVGFSSSLPFTYDDSAGVAGGTYDFTPVVLHEITEVMGRMLLTGSSLGANNYGVLDLAHYSAPGTRDFSASTPGYLSVDGGVTRQADFNTTSGGDAGDWAASAGNDSFNAFANAGVVNVISPADLVSLDTVGWTLAGASPPPPRVPTGTPTGVVMSAIPGAVGVSQGAGGLNGAVALAQISQIGGPASDGYSYALGGAGAGSFTLSQSGAVATLATAPAGAAGAAGGKLYALTLTAADTSSGRSAPPGPANIIIGEGNADTIVLTSLTNIAPSGISFIYGLGGNDVINASGMSGKQFFDGGAGADVMTGGRGSNTYLYAAASESKPGSMDIITNFHAGDAIDLRGLGVALTYAGQLSAHANGLAPRSISWNVQGGNTMVYVNTSGSREAFSAANMAIELSGKPTLVTGNFLHM